MQTLMRDTITALRERLVAQLTAERSFAGMRSPMVLQCAQRRKTHRTVLAGVRPFTGMDAPMFRQRTGRRETGAAYLAGKRMDAGVREFVLTELTLADERLRTAIALKAFGLRVAQHVLSQIRFLREALAAQRTQERSFAAVRAQMIAQRRLHAEHSTTMRTAFRARCRRMFVAATAAGWRMSLAAMQSQCFDAVTEAAAIAARLQRSGGGMLFALVCLQVVQLHEDTLANAALVGGLCAFVHVLVAAQRTDVDERGTALVAMVIGFAAIVRDDLLLLPSHRFGVIEGDILVDFFVVVFVKAIFIVVSDIGGLFIVHVHSVVGCFTVSIVVVVCWLHGDIRFVIIFVAGQ